MEHSRRKAARNLLSRSGYKSGGHFGSDKGIASEAKAMAKKAVHQHEKHEHGGELTHLKLKDGGAVTGLAGGGRSHKPRGHKKGNTTVNIHLGGQRPEAVPVPVPKPVPVPVPPPAGAVPGPGAEPDAMPPTAAMGQPGIPAGLKKGGRAKKSFKYPIDDGAGGGEGRLEKAKAYGAPV